MEASAGNDDSLAPFIARIRRENEIEADRACELHARAFDEACRLAREMGKADPSLRKVILFGSALPGRAFRIDSDIDLAILGGSLTLFERRAASSRFRIDITRLDDMRPAVRDRVMTEGQVLYATPES